MSILAKYNKAMEDKDEAALRDIIHDDYTFTMHKSGTVLKKDDVVKWAMSGDINRNKVRVINSIHSSLKGEEIPIQSPQFTNFGTFTVRKKNSRIGRNPKTKEIKTISERNVILFKPSNEFKKKINITNDW